MPLCQAMDPVAQYERIMLTQVLHIAHFKASLLGDQIHLVGRIQRIIREDVVLRERATAKDAFLKKSLTASSLRMKVTMTAATSPCKKNV